MIGKYIALVSFVIILINFNKYVLKPKNNNRSELNPNFCKRFDQILIKYSINETLLYRNIKYPINRKYAVFSMAYNYDFSKFKFYVDSVRGTGYKGYVFLFVKEAENSDILEYLRINGIDPLFINEIWPYYSSKNVDYFINTTTLNENIPKKEITGYWKFSILRYSLLYVFIKVYGLIFKYGFISDFKDIYFQLHPFQWNIPIGISLFEESRSISFNTSRINLAWVLDINTTKRYFTKYYIINAGQMFFTVPEVLDFLREYNRIIDLSIKLRCEQAIFNIIYYDLNYKNRKIYLYNTYFGPVRLLAGDAIYLFETKRIRKELINYHEILDFKNGRIVNCDGSTPTIIHFYYFKSAASMKNDINLAIKPWIERNKEMAKI